MPELPSEHAISPAAGARHQALLDFAVSQSSAVFYIADLVGERRTRFISANVEAITGHRPDAFVDEVGYGGRLVHPDDWPVYERAMAALPERGSLTVEYRFRCGDGGYRWFQDEQRLVPPDDGQPREFVGCMLDITQRVEAERETGRLSSLLREALESVPNGFGIYDAASRLQLCNSAFAAPLGCAPEELTGSTVLENTRRILQRLRTYDGKRVGDPEAILPHALARTREAEREAIEIQLDSGEWLQITSHPTADGGMVIIRTDITRLKQAETSLSESEVQFRSIVEANPSPVRVSEFETWEIIYESPAAAALFGRSWPARDGRSTIETYAEDAARQAVIDALQRERRIDNAEVLMRRADGSTFWAALSSRVVRFHGKDVCVTSLVDLTESKKREAELRQAHETLEDAIESLSEGLVLYDAEDRLVLCNSQYREFHRESEDLLMPGAYWPDVTRARAERGLFKEAQGDIEGWLEGQMAERGVAANREFPFADDRWFEYSHRPTRQGGFVSTWRDITERKRMEQNLRESEALVRQVLEASPVPLRMWRPDTGDVLYESPASAELFRRDATKLKPEERRNVYVNLEDHDNYLTRLRRDGAVDGMEMQLRKADGELFWGAVSARLIEYRGEPVVVSSILDLSERKAMEQALRESEQQFRMLVEEHPLPVWMIDTATGNLLYESPAAAELSGRKWLPGEERNVREFWADPPRRKAFVEKLKAQGKLENFEIEFRRADGTMILVTTNSRLIHYRDRDVHITVLIDLTEQRMREEELRHVRETLEDAIESMPEGFSLFDSEDRLVMCNSRFREFSAPSADSLVPGTPWIEFIRTGVERGQYLEAVGCEEAWLQEREARHSLGNLEGMGIEFEQSDGRWFHAFSQSTRQGGYVGIRIDVTERKRMELALRDSEELIRHVLEASAVPISMNRLRDGKVIYENPAANAMFGESPLLEPLSVESYWVDPKARERCIAMVRESGTLDGVEIKFRRRDGGTFWASLFSRLITYQGEEVVVDTIFDLTDRHAAEAELARQREMLHQSEKLSALGELLAGVSHELNNPLSVLVGQALMLSEGASDQKTAARAEKISKAADRCARIVKTFLAMARQDPREVIPIDLNEVIESALEVTAYSLRTAGIDCRLRLAEDLPAVEADPDQMRQVMTNLIVNAQHALQDIEGKRRLVISTVYRKQGNQVVIKVKDNGPGIPAEIRSRIFEPLYTTKGVGTGTGIGLALCHRVVVAHGGSIVVESPPGEGAAFAIRLPCADPRKVEGRASAAEEGETKRYRVLVVDDEEEVGQIISDVLELDGHVVEIAGSGADALEKIRAQTYDVVLSDMRMPGMDGPGLYRAIEDSRPELLAGLAFITGDTLSPRVKEFLESSGRPYLEKPIVPRDIRSLVAHLIGHKAG